jgi:membrane associated rhomboid family serine protease
MFPLYDDNPATRPAIVTYLLIAINVLVLIYMTLLPLDQRQLLVFDHGFIPVRTRQLTTDQALQIPFERLAVDQRTGRIVKLEQNHLIEPNRFAVLSTLFTCMFMHGGWMHLIGNMWFLKIFGNNIEDRLGHSVYLFFYLLGGLLATAGHWLQDPNSVIPVIGASGAVAAILGAYAVTFPHARIHTLVFLFVFITFWDLPAMFVLGAWFIGQLFAAQQDLVGGTGQGVAFVAHVAGFVAGAALMPLFRMVIPPPVSVTASQPRDRVEYDRF